MSLGPLNSLPVHLHETDIDEWVMSIIGPHRPLDYNNWVDDSCERKQDPTDWIADRTHKEIETFWSIALGLFLQLDCVRHRPEQVKFVINIAPDALWAVFYSPWAWFWETQDWDFLWNGILRRTSVLSGRYPVDAYPACVPTNPDASGEFALNWTIPYRFYFNATQGHIDGFNATLAQLRMWKLHANKCLIANCNWTNATITNCTFTRCTFRNCTFSNVHFLDSTFSDVDFFGVHISDSMITHTSISGTSIRDSTFRSAGWSSNSLRRCLFHNVKSTRSNWSHVYYDEVELVDYTDVERTENWVRMTGSKDPVGGVSSGALSTLHVHACTAPAP